MYSMLSPVNLDKLAEISHDIDEIVEKYRTDYLEGVLLYCEQNSIEIDAIAEYIRKNDAIKSKVEKAAEDLNHMKRKKRLPI